MKKMFDRNKILKPSVGVTQVDIFTAGVYL